MPNRVEQAIVRTSLPALNDINDAYPANNTPSMSGATNTYAAQLGARVWLDGNPGGVRYDSTIGTLYGGKYQYVKTTAGTTAAYVLGRLGETVKFKRIRLGENVLFVGDDGVAVCIG